MAPSAQLRPTESAVMFSKAKRFVYTTVSDTPGPADYYIPAKKPNPCYSINRTERFPQRYDQGQCSACCRNRKYKDFPYANYQLYFSDDDDESCYCLSESDGEFQITDEYMWDDFDNYTSQSEQKSLQELEEKEKKALTDILFNKAKVVKGAGEFEFDDEYLWDDYDALTTKEEQRSLRDLENLEKKELSKMLSSSLQSSGTPEEKHYSLEVPKQEQPESQRPTSDVGLNLTIDDFKFSEEYFDCDYEKERRPLRKLEELEKMELRKILSAENMDEYSYDLDVFEESNIVFHNKKVPPHSCEQKSSMGKKKRTNHSKRSGLKDLTSEERFLREEFERRELSKIILSNRKSASSKEIPLEMNNPNDYLGETEKLMHILITEHFKSMRSDPTQTMTKEDSTKLVGGLADLLKNCSMNDSLVNEAKESFDLLCVSTDSGIL